MRVMVQMPPRAVGVNRGNTGLCDGRCAYASSTGSCGLPNTKRCYVRRKRDAVTGKWRRTKYCWDHTLIGEGA